MSKELGPREKQLREQRERNFARRNEPRSAVSHELIAAFKVLLPEEVPQADKSSGGAKGKPQTPAGSKTADGLARNTPRGTIDGSSPKGPDLATARSAAVRLPKGPATATNSKRPAHKIIEGLKEAIAVARGEAEPAKVIVVKVGRPKRTEAQPWEALGISKASYYRRQAKAAKGEME